MAHADDHDRSIVHIDVDCFYAQVETIKNPALVDKPLGIQQKNIVVTSNYKAREYGIQKCMLISEALKLCPELVLVNGEDLHDYRQISYQVTNHLQKFSPHVERLGLDENYVDVTDLVQWRSKFYEGNVKATGCVYGETSECCDCGCHRRLCLASIIAQEMRDSIKEEFKLTTCAGIAHNKLLAKIVGSKNKPNLQTVLFPNNATQLLFSLKSITEIPGIGKVVGDLLKTANILTVRDVHNVEFDVLTRLLGNEKAKFVYDLCCGVDRSIVKATGKPQTIGLEDSCKSISGIGEVKEKLLQLLRRLMVLVSEDGRMPRTIRLTVRIQDKNTNTSRRETKQCNLNTSLFVLKDNTVTLPEKSEEKLMVSIVNLLGKIVNLNKPYHITLLGLSFTKFLERMIGKCSIKSYLRKTVEVQSVTNIENKSFTPSMDCSPNRSNDFTTDGSESEIEPSPKKTKKLSAIFSRRRFLDECPSPSKLKVGDLHLGGEARRGAPPGGEARGGGPTLEARFGDNPREAPSGGGAQGGAPLGGEALGGGPTPETRFDDNSRRAPLGCKARSGSPLGGEARGGGQTPEPRFGDNSRGASLEGETSFGENFQGAHKGESIRCPPNVDIDVFKELPPEIRQELWDQYSRKGNGAAQQRAKPKGPNTLLNYFVRNC